MAIPSTHRNHSRFRPRTLAVRALVPFLLAAAAASGNAFASMALSDGSDGAFAPTASQTLDLPDDGIFNFTTISIPSGVTVRFRRNAANTPVLLRASGAVSIGGVIDVSAGGVNLGDIADPNLGYIRPATTAVGGPGGGSGGQGGFGDTTCSGASCQAATAGTGPSPGQPGPTPTHSSVKVFGNAGGGGGMASEGLAAERYTSGVPGSPAVAYPTPLTGGSGGGGGSGWYFFGVQLAGGVGGGGGGALQISTPDAILLSGSLLALGGNGGWAFANSGGQGGPGGGGSGGNIALVAAAVTLLPTALVDVTGGYGGGLSTQTYTRDPRAFENGARGGVGYFSVSASQMTLAGTLNAVVAPVPLPPSLPLLLAGAMLVVRRHRGGARQAHGAY